MSKDKKHSYGAAYIPEAPKEVRKRGSGGDSSGRIAEIEAAIEEIKNSFAKSNRDNLDAMYNIDEDNLSGSFRRLLMSYEDGIVSARNEIKYWADQQSTGFEEVRQWKNEVSEAYSEISESLSENGAFYNEVREYINDQGYVTKEGVEGQVRTEVKTQLDLKLTENGVLSTEIKEFIKDQGYVSEEGLEETVHTEVMSQIDEGLQVNGAFYHKITSYIQEQDLVTTADLNSKIHTAVQSEVAQELTPTGSIYRTITSFDYQTEDDVSNALSSYSEQLDQYGAKTEELLEFKNSVDAGTHGIFAEYREAILSNQTKLNGQGAEIETLKSFKAEMVGEDGNGGTISKLTTAITEIEESLTEDGAFYSEITEFIESKNYQNGDEVISAVNSAINTYDESLTGDGGSITELLAFKSEVENGTNSGVNSAVTTAIAETDKKVNANEAAIQSLASWKTETADGAIESIASIKTQASENKASISQIVTAVGKNGSVTAASIVTAINDAGSSVKISADRVDIDGIARFTNVSGETDSITTVDGSKIALIADEYGDSISRLEFGKYKYATDTADNYTFDSMLHIKTVDNESDDKNLARFAAVIQTYNAYDVDTRETMATALKLISAGRMSMESEGSMYIAATNADASITIDASSNTRIAANRTYQKACEYLEVNIIGGYCFCTDGLYYDGELILPV